MPGVGLEPTRDFSHLILSQDRLPITTPGQILRPGWELHPRILVLQTNALATWLPGRVIYPIIFSSFFNYLPFLSSLKVRQFLPLPLFLSLQ